MPSLSYPWPWHEIANALSNAAAFPPKRQMTEEKIIMKAIVVTDQAAGTAGMKLVERRRTERRKGKTIIRVRP